MSKFTRDMWLLAAKRNETDESYQEWSERMQAQIEKNTTRHRFNLRDLSTVIAALRQWQSMRLANDYVHPSILQIASDGGSFPALTSVEIDELVQRINEAEPEEVVGYLYKRHGDGKVVTIGVRKPTKPCALQVIPLVAQ